MLSALEISSLAVGNEGRKLYQNCDKTVVHEYQIFLIQPLERQTKTDRKLQVYNARNHENKRLQNIELVLWSQQDWKFELAASWNVVEQGHPSVLQAQNQTA